MRLSTYLLIVTLMTLLGFCTVYEATRQTRARYKIGKLIAVEEAMRQDLARLKADLARLRSVRRLETLGEEMAGNLQPLRPVADVQVRAPLALHDPNH